MADPTFLIIRTKAPAVRFQRFCKANEACGGILTAAARLDEVAALEPGSLPLHIWIARFPSMDEARRAFANRIDASELAQPEPPLVLAARAVPDDGFPPAMDFVPTRKNTDPGAAQPPTLLLIEGSARDQERMDKYRDIILPMMKARRGYYAAFELGGNVEVLSGDWSEAIFAISRWPTRQAALDFWHAQTYQETAIPLRLDIGRFSVLMMTGEPDNA